MTLKLKLGDASHDLSIRAVRPTLVVEANGEEHSVVEIEGEGSARAVEIDGRRLAYRLARDGNTVHLHLRGRTWTVEFVDPRDAARQDVAGSDDIRAPMPGAVVSVDKRSGDAVTLGETILTIESMKLQTNLTAPRDGTLGAVLKEVGDTFDKDEVVATMEAEGADA